jgi:hypothetical protein
MAARRSCPRLLVSLTLALHSSLLPAVRISSAVSGLDLSYQIDAYSAYQSATGSTMDTQTGLLRITLTQYNALENLNFNIGSVGLLSSKHLYSCLSFFEQSTFVLTPNGQIWPRSLNTYIGGSSSSVYLIVGDLGSPTGEGLDFVNGYAFLERFYSVFDTDNSRVGFATTSCTDSTLN